MKVCCWEMHKKKVVCMMMGAVPPHPWFFYRVESRVMLKMLDKTTVALFYFQRSSSVRCVWSDVWSNFHSCHTCTR